MEKQIEKFKFIKLKSDEFFNPLTINPETPFTQAQFYGGWQKETGREVKRFLIYDNNEVTAYFQLIKYPLIFGKSYFYIPYGPIIKKFSKELIIFLKQTLLVISKKENIVFIRLDFTPIPNKKETNLLKKYFHKSPLCTYHSAYFQPRDEWFLELNQSEEDILKNMHQKTRYSIRLAKRRGIETKIINSDFQKYFNIFYQLINETAKRNNFSVHPKKYYKNIFENVDKNKNTYLSIATYQGEILIVNLVIVYGKVANYVFGSSSNKYRNLQPSYLAHWESICNAKKIGCTYYNFGGISSDEKTYRGWANLSNFKKKFGGKPNTHSKFYDLKIQPFFYYLYIIRKLIKTLI